MGFFERHLNWKIIIWGWLALTIFAIVVVKITYSKFHDRPVNLNASVQDQNIKAFKNWLLENPEFLLEVGSALNKKQKEQLNTKAKEKALANVQRVLDDVYMPVIGNPKAEITVIQFFDYQCGYCVQMYNPLRQILTQDKHVKVVMVETPVFYQRVPTSAYASKLGMAIYHRHGSVVYEKYHNAIFESVLNHEGKISAREIENIIKHLNLNLNNIDISKVDTEKNIALLKELGGNGTPYMLVLPSKGNITKDNLSVISGSDNLNDLINAINGLEEKL